ncbi:hypothetical protein HPB48_018326 [Haemaphysalis longicornis]|uniref:Uncharacterized protein n=1 Tax=Haemaphysalis longicornis TaxID=44386 RepID=A0A9J6FQT7_HAELO|nr:hypothetical protein HPB48_018326 [Haemaphysalis longicornis]
MAPPASMERGTWKNQSSLQVMPSLHDSQRQFIEVLGASADNGTEVNINQLCERLTFDVISKTAFGIDTEVQKNPDNPFFQTAITVFPNITDETAYHIGRK